MSVDCNVKLINHVVCFSRKKNFNRNKKAVAFEEKLYICVKTSILYKKLCYFFFQYEQSGGKNVLSTCRNKGLSKILRNDSLTQQLFSIISEVTGEIRCDFAIINRNKGKVDYSLIKRGSERYLKPIPFNKFSVQRKNCVFFSCKGNMIKQNKYKGFVYKQSNGHYSSVIFLCDGKQWHYKKNLVQRVASCKTPHCTDLKCNISVFFYKSISGNFRAYSQQEMFTVSRKIILVPCKNSEIKEENLVNDLVSDCGLSADDEPKYKALLLKENFYQCPLNLLPCRYGHSKCYNFHELCIFRLNKYSNIIPCRTGSHLEFCKNFECNVHFKCPGYYFIPWGYVCDGKWDCPEGYDESAQISCGLKRL